MVTNIQHQGIKTESEEKMTGRATSSRPAKRQRSETLDHEKPVAVTRARKTQTLPDNFNGDLSTLPDFKLNPQSSFNISLLPPTLTNALLAYAATRDSHINSLIDHQLNLQIDRELARVINFSQYYEEASYLLNGKYAHFLGSQAYSIAVDVVFKIIEIFKTILDIVNEAGGYCTSSYATRKNAVETMTDIMMSVVTAPGVIGREARRVPNVAENMEDKFLMMMTYFEEEELAQLDAEGWTDKVRELHLADRNSLYKNLNEAVEMLEHSEEDSEEDSEEGSEEDDEVE